MTADDAERARTRLLATERAVPEPGLRRLWKTGKSAATMALATVGDTLRRRESLDPGELERIVGLVTELGELKGVAMKAGQILGYVDPTLAPELRALLSLLQTASPASPFPEIESTLRASLGERAEALLSRLDRSPIAVASIGQVHRGVLPDGTEVAVKVRHPGVLEAMESDFRAARSGSAIGSLFAPGSGATVRSFVDEARDAILSECDYVREAESQESFGRLLGLDPSVVVPRVERDFCAPAVLTTRFTPGRSLDAFVAAAGTREERDRLGLALFSFYVATLYRHGLFHADPHPGNYAVDDAGRLVVYDFGCVRSFDPGMVSAFARLVRAVRADEWPAIAGALEALGARAPSKQAAKDRVRELLRGFFGPVLCPGRRAIDPGAALASGEVMRDKRTLLALGLPGKLLFLFRLRFGLYAVLARLGAEADWAAEEIAWAEAASG